MSKMIDSVNKTQLKNTQDIRPGDSIKVYQKIKEGGKERIQIFEGLVIVKKHGKGVSATITVRRILQGVGVERIFPIHSPAIEKIEIVKRGKVRRAKLGYLRTAKGTRGRLKRRDFAEVIAPEEPKEVSETTEEKPSENISQN